MSTKPASSSRDRTTVAVLKRPSANGSTGCSTYMAMNFDTALAFAFPSVLSIPYGLSQTLPRILAAVG